MKKLILLSLPFLVFCSSPKTETETFTYPVSAKVDTVDTYFSTDVPDPYRWLEDDNSEETAEWVKAQNEVTFGYLDNVDFRDKMKNRLRELLDYERISAPFKEGEYEYWYKNEGLQNHSVIHIRATLFINRVSIRQKLAISTKNEFYVLLKQI